jgi:hypothetical protein
VEDEKKRAEIARERERRENAPIDEPTEEDVRPALQKGLTPREDIR